MALRPIQSGKPCRRLIAFALAALLLPLTAHAAYVDVVLDDAPVAYYRLGETLGTTATNIGTGGSVLNGTYSNFVAADMDLAGPRPLAFRGFESDNVAKFFDGTDNRVEVLDNASLDIVGKLTLEAWVKVNSPKTDNVGIVAKYRNQSPHLNQRAYSFYIDGNQKLGLALSTDGTWPGATTLGGNTVLTSGANAQWTHVAAVFDPSARMEIYVNGILDAQLSSGVPSSIANTAAPLWIGTQFTTTPTNHFDGLIDEVAVYNTALSGQQIAAHVLEAVRVPHSAIMHLPLDETTGNVAFDATPRGNDGTLTGSGFTFDAASVSGKFANALQFDGVNDYIAVANSASLPGPNEEFTVAFWAKSPDWDNRDNLLVDYNLNGLKFNMGLHNSSDAMLVAIDAGSGVDPAVIPVGSLPNNEFAHFAFVFNSDSEIDSLYVNGEAVAQNGSTVWYFSETEGFSIGRRFVSGVYSQAFFQGAIDDFAIFNRALTGAQVGAVMNFGVSAFTIPEPSTAMLLIMASLALLTRRRRAR